MHTYEIAAIVAAAILGIDALIHAYWLSGRTWPARDGRELSRVVLNTDVPFTPRVLTPLVIILAGGATVILAKAGLLTAGLTDWAPTWVLTAGTLAVAAGALARACAGVVWALGIGASRGTTFYRLNIVAYTPICFLLCGAAAAVTIRV